MPMHKHGERVIEQRLHALQAECPGRRFSAYDIQRYTGVSANTVAEAERSGLRKLRHTLRGINPSLFDELIATRTA